MSLIQNSEKFVKFNICFCWNKILDFVILEKITEVKPVKRNDKKERIKRNDEELKYGIWGALNTGSQVNSFVIGLQLFW